MKTAAAWRRGAPCLVLALSVAATQALVVVTAAFAHQPGWMTGGGVFFNRVGVRVTHGFRLNCVFPEGADPLEPNRLQVNWEGNRFHLEELDMGECADRSDFEEAPPEAGFDTYSGAGVGRYNGVYGAYATWRFIDGGEPGGDDTAKITIWDADGNKVLGVDAVSLSGGNHQAHGDD